MLDIFGSYNSLAKLDTQRWWLRHIGFPLFKGIQASPSRVHGRSPPLFLLDLTLWYFYIRAVNSNLQVP